MGGGTRLPGRRGTKAGSWMGVSGQDIRKRKVSGPSRYVSIKRRWERLEHSGDEPNSVWGKK